jgi:nucleotide-binding universal stress UspA family protein
MMRTILVPLDGSHLSEAALPYAEALAKVGTPQAGRIVLMRAVETGWTDEIMTREELNRLIAAEADQCKRYLEQTAEDFRRRGIDAQVLITQGQSAVAGIASVAKQVHADMIVMASHGLSGVVRAFLGSVADKVIHDTHLPVMLIRPGTPVASGAVSASDVRGRIGT